MCIKVPNCLKNYALELTGRKSLRGISTEEMIGIAENFMVEMLVEPMMYYRHWEYYRVSYILVEQYLEKAFWECHKKPWSVNDLKVREIRWL